MLITSFKRLVSCVGSLVPSVVADPGFKVIPVTYSAVTDLVSKRCFHEPGVVELSRSTFFNGPTGREVHYDAF